MKLFVQVMETANHLDTLTNMDCNMGVGVVTRVHKVCGPTD
jgi:hypothetical protein